jgi:pimeloyl-ACP methyl ester carboxylesterase
MISINVKSKSRHKSKKQKDMIIEKIYAQFRKNYEYLQSITGQETKDEDSIQYRYEIAGPNLRPGNGPRIFHHGKKTDHAIVLTHGLSDSPRYVEEIGKCFHQAGLNVVLPLLPGHGLHDPDKAFEDKNLDAYWRHTIDHSVELAASLGNVVSIGGFSTGGALSYNRILREMQTGKKLITGGLFLFSAAIELVPWGAFLVSISPQRLFKRLDGVLEGKGPDPYKYPRLPKFGAKELDDIIRENEKLSKGKKLKLPVFAAHFLSDDTADVNGILKLLKDYATTGSAFIIGEELKKRKLKNSKGGEERIEWANSAHASLPLQSPIILEEELGEVPPNPQFEMMMNVALDFFVKQVLGPIVD